MEEKNNSVYGVGYGKLYIAGEYAILEDCSSAILTTVDKKITATVSYNKENTVIKDNLFNEKINLEEENSNFTLIKKLILFIQKYCNKKDHFYLEIDNELYSNNNKYGLGSSGAVLVAITKALLSYYNKTYNNLKIFKLLAIFCLKNNISGSMGDIAASCSKGLVYYKKFQKQFVLDLINTKSISEAIAIKWPCLSLENIYSELKVKMIAKWTGEIIDTKEHVKLWNNNKKNKVEEYNKFLTRSNMLVEQMKNSLLASDTELFINSIKKIRENLYYLEKISNIPMETNKMKNYILNFECGKQSGSGSGDMVLGFEKSDKNFNVILDLDSLS